jgi:hypothetical protein
MDNQEKKPQNIDWLGIPKIVWALGIGTLLTLFAWCITNAKN